MPPKLPESMPWEIYQAYLRGPWALIKLFEEAFGRVALCGPPDPDQQQAAIDDLSAEIDRHKVRIEKLQEEIRDLHYRNFQLVRRNAELEALAAKDSHNSSRPPSSDPTWAKRTKSLRRPSGKKPGGQAGHQGATLKRAVKPDRVVEHRPPTCGGCQASLSQSQIIRQERQQVIDLIPARLKVTEHHLLSLRCGACGRVTKGEFPQAVRSGVQYGPRVRAHALYLSQYQLLPYERTAEAMRDLTGCCLSLGTVANMVRECAEGLIETELKIKRKLRRSPVIHADETGLRVAKRGHYIHVASNSRLTHYTSDSRRGRAAIDEAGILPRYRGTCVHDGWWSYDYYTNCRHALCGAHLLRELTFFVELNDEQKTWAGPLKELLLEIKSKVEEVRSSGGKEVDAREQQAFGRRYDELIERGLDLNPAPPNRRKVSDAAATPEVALAGAWQKQAGNLAWRMQRKKDEVLRFMTDLSVPFENNQAERDLRMVRLQQKISGCFRSPDGSRAFCRVRSFLSTMKKQGREVVAELERVFRQPQPPEFFSR